jgi:integrase
MAVIQLMVPVIGRSNPREKNSPLPGMRTHNLQESLSVKALCLQTGLVLADFMKRWKQQTLYPQPQDWVFPSLKLRGRKPRAANMLVEDYLRPAAVRTGVLAKTDTFRFGFHNLRHSLASFLVRTKTDPKTVQALLRENL